MKPQTSNEMWKLDLLEVKFNASAPRFPHTRKLLQARNNSKLLKKLPTNPAEAQQQILALKKDFFSKKYYAAFKKLEKEVAKVTASGAKKGAAGTDPVAQFTGNPQNIDTMVTSKLAKVVQTAVLTTKDLRATPPAYIPADIVAVIADKAHRSNPSRFFIDNCQNNKPLNSFISSVWNNKAVKQVLADIEWSFKVVRGDLTRQEKDARKAQTGGKDTDEAAAAAAAADSDDSDDSDSDDSDSDDADSEIDVDQEIDNIDEAALSRYAVYDQLDGDASGDEQFALDPNVNYNEITDEEPSDDESSGAEDSDAGSEDSFFEGDSDSGAAAPKKTKKADKADKAAKAKHNLPELATGYFSGGESDSDADNDEVVKAATTQRKNRRGQRARQKIWEQKYGKEAKHVKSERQRYANEREQKQKEYEERCRRREEKARQAMETAPSGSNVLPLGERKARPDTPDFVSAASASPAPVSDKVHPSWEAKRLADEKQKNVKFTGKKITFD